MSVPVFDQRNAAAIFADALALAKLYSPQWGLPDGEAVTPDAIAQDPGLVLLKLFSLLGQDLASVINAIPVQRQLALYRFLDMSLRPAACASAPLSFSLDAGSACVILPKGTAIADSSTRRLRFETDRDLQVLPATLCTAVTVSPRLDRFWDARSFWSSGNAAPSFPGSAGTAGECVLPHVLLLGDGALFNPATAAGTMTVTLRGARLDPDYFQRWYDGAWNPLKVNVVDSADQRVCTIRFDALPSAVAQPIAALHASIAARAGHTLDTTDPSFSLLPQPALYWLACEPAEDARVVPALDGYLPRIDSMRCDFGTRSTAPQQAAANGISIDLVNGAYVFGSTPALDSTFAIRSDTAFAGPGAQIAIGIELRPLSSPRKVQVAWQYWNGTAWVTLAPGEPYGFFDGTANLTTSGTISFLCPPVTQTTVAGYQGLWIRAVVTAGDFGDSKQGIDPPFARSLVIEYASGGVPSSVWAHNAFELDAIPAAASYHPYRPLAEEGASFYLGFEPAALVAYGLGRQLTLYFDLDPADEHLGHRDPGTWEWFDASGEAWQRLSIDVADVGLARSGTISFTVPEQVQGATMFSQTACWFRVLCPRRRHAANLRGVYPNAVSATNRSTYRNEVLGSSNGQPGQRFTLNRVTTAATGSDQILVATSTDPTYDVQVEVLEPITAEVLMAAAVGSASDPSQTPQSAPYPWTRVGSFIGQGPDDRVFTLDIVNGTIVFGDGLQGKIPPPGTHNVISTCYATTRGAGGNVAAGDLTILPTATPGIAQVTNPVGARGGADVDTIDDLIVRGPALVRANDRAVTAADVEALACAASTGVCRARAIEYTSPSRLEQPTPHPVIPAAVDSARTVSDLDPIWPRLEIVVLAESSEPEPLTPMSMLDDVLTYVRARSAPPLAARTTARRPSFKRIDVEVLLQTNAPKAQWPDMQADIAEQLTQFLHPARGGATARGWPIGEPIRYTTIYQFLLASNKAVTAVIALALCGSASDIALEQQEAPAAGSMDIRFAQVPQS